jgi:hypothetical protein
VRRGFDPLRCLRTLDAFGVEFVLIGGFAGSLFGSELITGDVDICYSRSPENLDRLADALTDLEAELRGVEERVPFRLEAGALAAGDSFTFTTRCGPLDILGVPAGSDGFEDLRSTATTMDLGGFRVAVADLEDLIRMKRAAGRPKDLAAVEHLAALRDVIDGVDEH